MKFLKFNLKMVILICSILPTMLSAQRQDYYYYKGDKIYLDLDLNSFIISVLPTFEVSSLEGMGFKEAKLEDDRSQGEVTSLVRYAKIEFLDTPSDIVYDESYKDLKSLPGMRTVSRSYQTDMNVVADASDYLYVKLNVLDDKETLLNVASDYSIDVIEQNEFMPLWYTLRCNESTTEHALDLANYIYETGLFAASSPDFITYDDLDCANDDDFAELWGLYNTSNPDIDINACEAWAITEGSGVNVAILDQGIMLNHPDLVGNLFPLSYDTESNSSPSQLYGTHGVHVAGIAGAMKDNNLQVVGVAPQCKLMSVSNSFSNPNTRIKRADGINWASGKGADIINNSWSSPIYFQPIDEAIENALEYGRNGLGTIIVFSAGNNNGAPVLYPANYHPDILAVGSIWLDGQRSSFSNYSAELDVVAPGSNILSTVFDGSVHSFSGTSQAAPHVSGIAALILSVNPCLSVKQVNKIIESTAQNVGPYSYTNYADRPNGGWNNEMGYGLVDAHAAVLLALENIPTSVDLYMTDTDSPFDIGQEPSPAGLDGGFGRDNSSDIWVRNQNDGLTNQLQENLIYDASNPFYAYVRVQNRSCEPSVGGNLDLYWSRLGSAQSWPTHWDGSYPTLGNQIGSLTLPNLAPGESVVLEFPWDMSTDLELLEGGFVDACLLARITGLADDPITAYPNSLFEQIFYNNNVAQRNVVLYNASWRSISDLEHAKYPKVWVGSVSEDLEEAYNIHLYAPKLLVNNNELVKEAEVTLKLDELTWDKWQKAGGEGEGFEILKEESHTLLITSDSITFFNLIYEPNERSTIGVGFNFLTKEVGAQNNYVYRLLQTKSDDGSIVGGVTFQVSRDDRELFKADAGADKEIKHGESITISAKEIAEAAEYNWYDMEGNLVHTGTDFETAPEVTQQYQLEVISLVDGFKDYAEVEVKVNEFDLISLSPNPAIDEVKAIYNAELATSAYLMIVPTNSIDGVSNNYILDITESEVTLDLSSLANGLYTVALVCDGEIKDALILSIQ